MERTMSDRLLPELRGRMRGPHRRWALDELVGERDAIAARIAGRETEAHMADVKFALQDIERIDRELARREK